METATNVPQGYEFVEKLVAETTLDVALRNNNDNKGTEKIGLMQIQSKANFSVNIIINIIMRVMLE